MTIATAADVLAFWRAAGQKKWFAKDDAFDAEIRARFLATYEAAARGDLSDWEATPEGALALTIVLDQFPRNMFRHDARAFAADATARARRGPRARARLRPAGAGRTSACSSICRSSIPRRMADQERCCALFRAMGNADLLRWAELHADIIRRFGRFPHRNAVLGRTTTPAEKAYLDNDGFAG